jgi:hypothetical protein
VPAPQALDGLDLALVETLKRTTRAEMARQVRSTPLGRFATPANWGEWRLAFFYWFSSPDGRAGTRLNYAACRGSALVSVYANGYAALDCRREAQASPVTTVVSAAPPAGSTAPGTAAAAASPPPVVVEAVGHASATP